MKNKKRKAASKKTFPVWVWALLVIGLVAILVVIALNANKPAVAPLPLTITVAQAADMRDHGAFVLDVREPSEWTQFHIPGATLIPLGSLPNRLGEVPKDRQVIVVCRTGVRSAQGRDILLKAGFAQVTSMTGGMNQWQAQGLPIAMGQ